MSRKASGFRAWLMQRVSAVYLALYFIYLSFYFILSSPVTYEQWRLWLAKPLVGASMALFFLALLVHAWVGMRDIVVDYIGLLAIRLMLLTAIALLLAGCGFWVLRILVLVAL